MNSPPAGIIYQVKVRRRCYSLWPGGCRLLIAPGKETAGESRGCAGVSCSVGNGPRRRAFAANHRHHTDSDPVAALPSSRFLCLADRTSQSSRNKNPHPATMAFLVKWCRKVGIQVTPHHFQW